MNIGRFPLSLSPLYLHLLSLSLSHSLTHSFVIPTFFSRTFFLLHTINPLPLHPSPASILIKEKGRKFIREGIYTAPVLSQETGELAGELTVSMKWNYSVIPEKDARKLYAEPTPSLSLSPSSTSSSSPKKTKRKSSNNGGSSSVVALNGVKGMDVSLEKPRLEYRFVYCNEKKFKSEFVRGFKCVWCSLQANSIEGLYDHLRSSHSLVHSAIWEASSVVSFLLFLFLSHSYSSSFLPFFIARSPFLSLFLTLAHSLRLSLSNSLSL